MVLSSSEILWLFEKHNLCPSNLDDDKVAGHGGAVQGAVAWAERRRVFLDRETSTSKGMEVDSRSTERRAAAQVGCRTGGAGMQRFPHWVEDSGQDLVDSGEWMKSLDQENRLIKVHLILELQTPHKPVRYHKRITWTGGGGGGGGKTLVTHPSHGSSEGAATTEPWKIILQESRSSVAKIHISNRNLNFYVKTELQCRRLKGKAAVSKYTSKYSAFERMEGGRVRAQLCCIWSFRDQRSLHLALAPLRVLSSSAWSALRHGPVSVPAAVCSWGHLRSPWRRLGEVCQPHALQAGGKSLHTGIWAVRLCVQHGIRPPAS